MASSTKSESKDIGSAFDLLGKSAQIVKKNWKMFLAVNIFTILGSAGTVAQSDPDKNVDSASPWGSTFDWADGAAATTIVLVVAAFVLLALFFYAMSINLEVKASKGKSPNFSELVADGKKYMFPLFGQMILIGAIVLVGLILFIVPGIFAIMRLIMAPYIMVDQKLGIVDSLKRSNELAKANSDKVWALVGVLLVVMLITGILQYITIVGVIVSLVLTIAWSLIVPLRYLQLKKI